MKRLVLMVLCIAAASSSLYSETLRPKADAVRNPADIVDYFLIAPFYRIDIPGYVAGNGYDSRVKTLGDSEKHGTAVIDRKNAYISVSYRDDADMENRVTMTYFNCADRSRIVAVSTYYNFDGTVSYSHSFLKHRNGRFSDVTKEVLSGLSFKNFLGGNAKITPRMDEYIMDTTANFVLPRKGTTVVVELKGDVPFLPDCDLEFNEDEYIRTYRARKYTTVEMQFDAGRGVFIINGYK